MPKEDPSVCSGYSLQTRPSNLVKPVSCSITLATPCSAGQLAYLYYTLI